MDPLRCGQIGGRGMVILHDRQVGSGEDWQRVELFYCVLGAGFLPHKTGFFCGRGGFCLTIPKKKKNGVCFWEVLFT